MLARLVCVLGLAALAGCIPEGQVRPSGPVAAPMALSLRRGMNVGNALDAPTEGAWGVVLEPQIFDAVAAAGFDHVRIPIRFSAHAAVTPPYRIDEDFLRRVDWAVDQVLSRRMTAIVDLHHYKELMDQPDAHADRFVAMWKQIAKRLRGRPASVVYELLNEPSGELGAERWNALLEVALRAVREVDPERTIIVDSVFWAAAKELASSLRLPANDPHLVGSFHMYQPILFTHQGMPWMPPEFGTVGIVFPGPPRAAVEPVPAAQKVDWVADWLRRYNTRSAEHNPSGPATITEEFDHARAFAERTGLPVYMGEFGAGDRADMASRVAWTRMVRREAERRGIGWAYWDDGGSFKAYDQKTRTWNAELRSALLE